MSTSAEHLQATMLRLQQRLSELEIANKELRDNSESRKDPLKIPPPKRFDGNQAGLRTFLTQSRLYLDHYEANLKSEADKVKTPASVESLQVSYIDDFTFMVASKSLRRNCLALEEIYSDLVRQATQCGIEFEPSKTELLHLTKLSGWDKCTVNI
ncbi:hypothetical protein SEPCBS57363_006826, partial [Sporothrix epigloea]